MTTTATERMETVATPPVKKHTQRISNETINSIVGALATALASVPKWTETPEMGKLQDTINVLNGRQRRSPEEQAELVEAQNELNNLKQGFRRNKALNGFEHLAKFLDVTDPRAKAARKLIVAHCRDSIKSVNDTDKTLRKGTGQAQMTAYCQHLASEKHIKEFVESIVADVLLAFIYSEDLMDYGTVFGGNTKAPEVVEIVAGIKPSSGAADRDVIGSAIAEGVYKTKRSTKAE